jgi:hypothetical protein
MSKRSEFIKKCMDDPKSVTQEELQDNYEADIKKYYVAREDRLYKLSQGSDTAVWAHDEILKQDKRIAELKKELNVPINLNQFNYAFYKTNSGSVDGFYEWLKKWKHISAKVDENE